MPYERRFGYRVDIPNLDWKVEQSSYLIYAIWPYCDTVVKVGKTTGSPYVRLKNLQTGCARKLILLAWTCRHLEAEAHTRMEWLTKRLTGEWFTLNNDVIAELLTWDWASAHLLNRIKKMSFISAPEIAP